MKKEPNSEGATNWRKEYAMLTTEALENLFLFGQEALNQVPEMDSDAREVIKSTFTNVNIKEFIEHLDFHDLKRKIDESSSVSGGDAVKRKELILMNYIWSHITSTLGLGKDKGLLGRFWDKDYDSLSRFYDVLQTKIADKNNNDNE